MSELRISSLEDAFDLSARSSLSLATPPKLERPFNPYFASARNEATPQKHGLITIAPALSRTREAPCDSNYEQSPRDPYNNVEQAFGDQFDRDPDSRQHFIQSTEAAPPQYEVHHVEDARSELMHKRKLNNESARRYPFLHLFVSSRMRKKNMVDALNDEKAKLLNENRDLEMRCDMLERTVREYKEQSKV
jgi:hypothetical protein